MRTSGRKRRGRLQARMARYIAFAVVVSLMVGTFGVVFYRYYSTRQALEASARRFAALVSVPLAQVADMYGDPGLRDPLMTRVSPLLQLNEDVEKLGIYRKSGQLVFFGHSRRDPDLAATRGRSVHRGSRSGDDPRLPFRSSRARQHRWSSPLPSRHSRGGGRAVLRVQPGCNLQL